VSFIAISLDAGDLQRAQDALRNVFGPDGNAGLANVMKAALEKAIKPAYLRLRELTPIGPTGNLERAASSKVVMYRKNGGAVGLVGYRQSQKEKGTATAGSVRLGKERGFHQWWLEFGTKERVVTKVSNKPFQRKAHTRRMKSGKVAAISAHQVAGQGAIIASSLAARGPFDINPDGTKSQPYAFFMKGKKGQGAIRIPATPAGGRAGRPPVQTALTQTQGQIGEILRRELGIALDAALAKVALSGTGTITGAIEAAGG
jgi:hypothetical protein